MLECTCRCVTKAEVSDLERAVFFLIPNLSSSCIARYLATSKLKRGISAKAVLRSVISGAYESSFSDLSAVPSCQIRLENCRTDSVSRFSTV